VKDVGANKVYQTVTLRGRLHAVRGKGKSAFLVLRQQTATIQAGRQNGCHRTVVTERSSHNGYYRTVVTERLSQNGCYRTVVTERLSQNGCHRTVVLQNGCWIPLHPVDRVGNHFSLALFCNPKHNTVHLMPASQMDGPCNHLTPRGSCEVTTLTPKWCSSWTTSTCRRGW
jgi:hypothetical protein